MKRLFLFAFAVTGLLLLGSTELSARGGGRGGFGGGGGGGRGGFGGGGGGFSGGGRSGGGGFSPSRGGGFDGGGNRSFGGDNRGFNDRGGSFGGGNAGGDRFGGAGNGNFGGANRPGGFSGGDFGREGSFNNRPSTGQLNDFLNIPRPSEGGLGNRPVAGGGAANDFLKGEGLQNAAANRPAAGNVFGGDRTGLENRPALENRPGLDNRPALENRPGLENRPAFANRPDRIQNRQEWMDNRGQRWNEVRGQVLDNYPRLNFWSNYPNWAAWRINAPFRWATWGTLSGWIGYGSVAALPYSYGDNYYFQDNSVYNDAGTVVASASDYAQQAESIASSVPATSPDQAEWLPLGVFAITQDGEATGTPPTRFMQLAVSKQGVINGLLSNKLTDETQQLEGAIDRESQRAAWTVKGQSRPIIETGLQNLTTDTGSALIHFEDGQTQQVLLVRLPDPDKKN